MREILLDPQAIDDLKWWISQDKRIAFKVIELIENSPNHLLLAKESPKCCVLIYRGFGQGVLPRNIA